MATQFPGRRFFVNGSNREMNVNGSGTPVEFVVAPPAGQVWEFFALNLVMTGAGNINSVTTQFFTRASLANGIDSELTKNGVTVSVPAIVQSNHELLDLFGAEFLGKIIGNTNVAVGQINYFPNVNLNGDLGDIWILRINDDLTTFETFSVSLQGSIVTL